MLKSGYEKESSSGQATSFSFRMSLVLYLAQVIGKTVNEIVNIFFRVFCLISWKDVYLEVIRYQTLTISTEISEM